MSETPAGTLPTSWTDCFDIVPADFFGYPGWYSVRYLSRAIRHFPTRDMADAFLARSDREYSLHEVAELCSTAYMQGLAISRAPTQDVLDFGARLADLFPGIDLPFSFARIEWFHCKERNRYGWQLAVDQRGTAVQALAAREQQWQAFLASVDDVIAWLSSQTAVHWPTSLSRAMLSSAAPLRQNLPAKRPTPTKVAGTADG